MKSNFIKVIVVLLIVGIIILLLSGFKDNDEYQKITYDDLNNLNDYILLDVRTIEEYNEGNLLDSVNLPIDNISDISNITNDFNQTIVVYCKSGGRSKTAAEYLIENGYTDVYDMGGIDDIDQSLLR